MADPEFFPAPLPLSIAEIADLVGARIANAVDPARLIGGLAPLDRAGPGDLTFLENARYAGQLAETRAGACLCQPRHAARVPPDVAALECRRPHYAFALIGARLYPTAMRPAPVTAGTGIAPGAHVDPTARLEDGVVVEPAAVVGPGCEIGRGTVVGPGAVIGRAVRIGRDCSIGAGVTVAHALIGDRVILHPGVRIGQDGFGYAAGPTGLLKVPQVGRVIIQDAVEIGANTTIDRGAIRDTVIGEGTKIDNQVQIGHNVVIGRHCIIVAQVGISGSATLGDGVAIGGQSGVNGHVRIGNGAQIAAVSVVHGDVPAGARWGGTPARPVREWFRAEATLRRLAARGAADKSGEAEATEGE